MLSQTGPGLTAEPRHGQWGPWTRLNQGSSDGAHFFGPMRHCREDCTGPGHGYAYGRWWLALMTAAVAQEDRARVRACGKGGSDGCNLGSGLQWIWRLRAWQMRVRQGRGYWRLRSWEEIGMKTFGPPPPLFINQLDN